MASRPVLKPSLKNKKVSNLYYTGQLTVPGPGVPPSIISGEVVANDAEQRNLAIEQTLARTRQIRERISEQRQRSQERAEAQARATTLSQSHVDYPRYYAHPFYLRRGIGHGFRAVLLCCFTSRSAPARWLPCLLPPSAGAQRGPRGERSDRPALAERVEALPTCKVRSEQRTATGPIVAPAA